MAKTFFPLFALLALVSCSAWNPSLPASTPIAQPSALPAIQSPTPPFVPSNTPTATNLPGVFTLTPSPTSTQTETPTATRTPSLELEILGCNTSLDILHQMGEVTNAYVVIRNKTGEDLLNVCATLSATDEGRIHPDKMVCAASIPAGYQTTLKLTVDTTFKQDTAVQVDAHAAEGFPASATVPSCRDIGLPGWVPDKVGNVEPIP